MLSKPRQNGLVSTHLPSCCLQCIYVHTLEAEKAFFHEHFGRPETVRKKKRRDSKVKKPVIGKAVTKKNVRIQSYVDFQPSQPVSLVLQAKGKTTLKKPEIQDSDSDYEESVCCAPIFYNNAC